MQVLITIDGKRKEMSLVGAAQKASERDSENRPVAVWEELILKAFGEEVGIGTNGIHIQPKF